ncbi:MAG: DinB family protein [Bryobacterales bacterium]|nr:DinB family protein [Bryobacterales bacterium]MBV9398557.1 DinB family protein [Bryobacterales bacterium]
MNYYGAKELAAAFRTVRNNTIQIAEDIPEDKYGFRATPENRSIGEMLIHIAHIPDFPYEALGVQKRTSMTGFDFMAFIEPRIADEKSGKRKAEIVKQLKDGRDHFANWLETLPESFLGEVVTMPPGGEPPSRSRFDMIMSVKEHEMHHRGQLMLLERMVGVVPHLTRRMEETRARMQQAAAKP